MGATVKGDTIYISKDLAAKVTPGERKIILAHEISHWKHKDNTKLFIIKVLFFLFPSIGDYFSRKIEARADKEAIKMTKDPDSFITLLDKLTRQGNSHPTKQFSLQLANDMRGQV